jgi:hypothetical protein
MADVMPPTLFAHSFAEPAFVSIPHPKLPRVRLVGVRVLIEMLVAMTQRIEVRADSLVKLILKNVVGGTWVALDEGGQPVKPPGKIIPAPEASDPNRDGTSGSS